MQGTSNTSRSGPPAATPAPHSPAPPPLVDYVIARDGAPPPRGLAYDYVLAGDGLFLVAWSRLLHVRIPVARCRVRGLPPLYAACTLPSGRLPSALWEQIVADALAADVYGHEVFLAVTHRPSVGYRLVRPLQVGGPEGVVYERQPDTVLEVHSHRHYPACFSPRDDRDEQRLAVYGVIGRLGSDRPEVRLRAGAYGYFLPLPWDSVFAGSAADRGAFRDANVDPPDLPELPTAPSAISGAFAASADVPAAAIGTLPVEPAAWWQSWEVGDGPSD